MTGDEAATKSPDYSQQDLYNAIERGEYPGMVTAVQAIEHSLNIATIALGYADGIPRALSTRDGANKGVAAIGGAGWFYLASDAILGHAAWETELDRLIAEHPQFARPAPETDVVYSGDDDFAVPVPHPGLACSGHRPGRPKVHEGLIGMMGDQNLMDQDKL